MLTTPNNGSSYHFLDEIIQNCDDNSYPHGVTPSLEIFVMPARGGGGRSEDGLGEGAGGKGGGSCQLGQVDIWVCNNEEGFVAEDVLAIW